MPMNYSRESSSGSIPESLRKMIAFCQKNSAVKKTRATRIFKTELPMSPYEKAAWNELMDAFTSDKPLDIAIDRSVGIFKTLLKLQKILIQTILQLDLGSEQAPQQIQKILKLYDEEINKFITFSYDKLPKRTQPLVQTFQQQNKAIIAGLREQLETLQKIERQAKLTRKRFIKSLIFSVAGMMLISIGLILLPLPAAKIALRTIIPAGCLLLASGLTAMGFNMGSFLNSRPVKWLLSRASPSIAQKIESRTGVKLGQPYVPKMVRESLAQYKLQRKSFVFNMEKMLLAFPAAIAAVQRKRMWHERETPDSPKKLRLI